MAFEPVYYYSPLKIFFIYLSNTRMFYNGPVINNSTEFEQFLESIKLTELPYKNYIGLLTFYKNRTLNLYIFRTQKKEIQKGNLN